jgi:hypothetical protein
LAYPARNPDAAVETRDRASRTPGFTRPNRNPDDLTFTVSGPISVSSENGWRTPNEELNFSVRSVLSSGTPEIINCGS